MPTATGLFRRLSFVTLVAVYFLIFIGGVVRSTGSGMGCPDWPKCFGRFIPPTTVSELPADYKEFYSDFRARKNARFGSFLERIGMAETARKLMEDPAVLEEGDFNAVKTWIEYVNRLIGALVGLLITAVFVFSFRHSISTRWWAGAAWFLVLVTGWFGSIVVSSNLTPWTVTIHLALAMAIVVCLVNVHRIVQGPSEDVSPQRVRLITIGFALFLLQTYLGTQVRSRIDLVAASVADRGLWIEESGLIFIIHRTFSWAVLIWAAVLVWFIRKKEGRGFPLGLIGLLLGLISSGTLLTYFGLPRLIQPVHLLLACMFVGWFASRIRRSGPIGS